MRAEVCCINSHCHNFLQTICFQRFTCKYVISAICISRMAGMPYLNFLCIVLWCQTFIPIHAPMLPPSTASNKSVASGIRHLAFLALYLSMPYTMNVTTLRARDSRRGNYVMCSYSSTAFSYLFKIPTPHPFRMVRAKARPS